jgi:hypothetical protein
MISFRFSFRLPFSQNWEKRLALLGFPVRAASPEERV